MNMQKAMQQMIMLLQRSLQASVKNTHTRIVSAGLLVGLCYLPFWLADIIIGTMNGAASVVMVGAVALGGYQLWSNRLRLSKSRAEPEDRWLGHGIILVGIALSPFCAFSEWSQKLLWMFILVGIAVSSWGTQFFQTYPLAVGLIGLGLFPQPTVVARAVWETFMPPQALERVMAWGGVLGLQVIGQPVTLTNGTEITLPGGTVDVAWGCNGFDMATIIAAASLILGIMLKQSARKIALMVVISIMLALLFNIPRIMLMAVSEAYWGNAAFEFWHGFWGGQIFSTILFTVYYYVVMALVKRRSVKSTASS
jgi:exosortase/archaeosortase family protein